VQAGELDHSSIKLMDGRTVAIQMQPLPDGGFVATHEDVTERCAAEARIVYLARHDVLTGLANRELFRERMEQAVANSGRGQEFAVLFLDLDRFKSVNDTFGHQVGDQLLRGVADRLLACVREVDTVARLGGDEFVILQVGLKMPDHAAILARRVLKVLRAPFFLAGQELIVGTSIGIAVAPDDGHSADTLIRKSDRALYVAKSAGRGTFHFHEADMDTDLAADAGKLRDLRSVMAPGDLQIR
jgi:diguanylate cyclase (GGDEF)-like protein